MSKAGGRPKDEHWSHVKADEDGKWSCIHCGKQFSGKISVTRIKAHLNKERGQGVAPCSSYRHNEGVHNNMASCSSNPQEPVNTVGSIQDLHWADTFLNDSADPSNWFGTSIEFGNLLEGYVESAEAASNLFNTNVNDSINPLIESDPLLEEDAPRRIDTVVSGSRNPLPEVAEGVPEGIDAIINIPNNSQNNVDNGGMDASSSIKNAFEREITHLNQLVSDLQSEKSYIEGRVQWLQCRGKKRKRYVDIWLNDLEEMRKRADEMNNFVHPQPDIYGLEIKQLIGKIRKHKEEMPLVLSTEFVGRNFEKNMKEVWKLLADDQVFIIGVYGMGGTGKTSLATQLVKEIKRKGTFKDVFWVTISHNFSISRLQHIIAKKMGIKLEEDDDDETMRALNLSEALETKEESILILDDVWEYIDLEKVGIPLKENGIKVIVTTRLKRVCQQMDCLPNNMIQMLPLNSHEAEELLKVKLGHNGTPATLPPELQKIATCIVNRFGGLPLGISMMARTMKGLDDIHLWKHTWNKLEKLETGEEMQEVVFKVLKRSYDNLMEKDLQKCFLYCALLPGLDRDELIMELVDNGLINGRRSLEEIFVEGKTILDNLEAHSLFLKSCMREVCVHRPVTDMACRILKESQRRVMVEFPKEKEFTKISHMQEWEDLELFYLMPSNNRVEIPEGASPCCPQLSTLILSGNHISHIPDCFFQNMNALTVVNLSGNERLECLPNSLSELRSLVSLVLRGCKSLKYVPPLGELQALSRLDISYCSIEKVPQGLEKLIKLKWLDLSSNKNLTMVLVDVLPSLTSMQYLDLRDCPHVKIKVEDVMGMNMLECFGGTFLNCKHYNHYLGKILDKGFGPKTYSLLFGNFCSDLRDLGSILPGDPKTKTIYFGDCKDFSHSHILPKDLTDLCIYYNNHWVCLCDALSCDTFSTLRRIEIYICEPLESLFCSSYSCSFCTKIQSLEVLRLTGLGSLTVICKEDVADVRQSLSMGIRFPCLKYFHISGCREIKKFLTPLGVLLLPNLERITVEDCHSMEEIFAVGNGDDDDGSSIITLPKLTTLELVNLPHLKTVCKGNILFGSSPTFRIVGCVSLRWS